MFIIVATLNIHGRVPLIYEIDGLNFVIIALSAHGLPSSNLTVIAHQIEPDGIVALPNEPAPEPGVSRQADPSMEPTGSGYDDKAKPPVKSLEPANWSQVDELYINPKTSYDNMSFCLQLVSIVLITWITDSLTIVFNISCLYHR